MARLSAAQQHAASVIAHAIVVRSMASNVQDMEGFEDFYLKKLSAQDRALVKHFRAELKRIPEDLARMMEKDRNGPST